MSIYNSQYESYYSKLVGKKGYKGNYNSAYPYRYGAGSSSSLISSNFIIKRLIRDLLGVFCLFIIVTGSKMIVTPETTAVYKFSKAVVNENVDYAQLLSQAKSLNIVDLQNKFEDYIDSLRARITGTETLKDKVNNSFGMPLSGKILSDFGASDTEKNGTSKFNNGIAIETKENSPVKACYDGKIKECGEDAEVGKYILIDHGKGLETKYGYLNQVMVKKGDEVKKGQVIGNSGKNLNTSEPALYFEFAFMGQPKDPKEYISSGSF